jgi:glutamyl-tRNA reductase
LEKAFSRLKNLSESEREVVDKLTHSIVKKLLHDPVAYLKERGCQKEPESHVNMIQKLFSLNHEDKE